MPRRQPPRTAITGLLVAGAFAATAVAVEVCARRAERRHPPPGRFITVDGIRLHYQDRRPDGDPSGPPVLILHGNGAMVEELAISGLPQRLARSRRVVILDRPGFGHSERPRGQSWTPAAQAALAWAAADRLELERPVIFGHSWGTMVAVAMALARPQDVAGLVLASGYYYPDRQPGILLAATPALPVLGPLLRRTLSPVSGWILAPYLIRKSFAPARAPEHFAAFPLSLALRPSQIRASAEDCAVMIPAARIMSRRYHELIMPVTILTDPQDHILKTERQSLRLHHTLGHSHLVEMDGAGHMLHHIRPERVAAAIEEIA